MHEVPKYVREYSKRESPEERDQLAQEITEKRKSYFDEKRSRAEKESEKNILAQEIEALADRIASHKNESFFTRLKDYFSIKKIEQQLQGKEHEKKALEEELSTPIKGRSDMDEIQTALANFYARQSKEWQVWSNKEYTKEDIARDFSEDHLASLLMKEYVALLQQYPGHMVTHVTRQGVRDHVGMFEHTKGSGASHDSFKNMLESKRLHSPLGVALSEAESFHDICEFLNGGEKLITNRDSVNTGEDPNQSPRLLVGALKGYTNEKGGLSFHDKAAVHFAIEKVLNNIYGGEKGNEIFIAYPAAHIASQYHFYNKIKKGVLEYPSPDSDNHNDLFVWGENELSGMNVDAGVVFIPGNAQVDVVTGSLYELDDSGCPIEIEVTDDEREINFKNFKKSQHAISSKEYWERYFAIEPKRKPSKIVYYDASLSPSQALWDWKAENGIISKEAEATLGFDEHELKNDLSQRPEGGQQMLRFHRLALDAIAYEYGIDNVVRAYDEKFFSRPREEWDDALNEIYEV